MHNIVYLISSSSRRVKEWIVAVVENRASTEDSLVAREAPVDSGVNGGPLRRVSVEHAERRMQTHVESADHLRESETVFPEHLQRLELLVIRPILEFQSNLIIPRSRQRQLQSNNRRVVSCVGLYEQKAEESATVFSPIPDIPGLVTVALVTLNILMNGL